MHLTGQYNWTITRYVVAQYVKGFFGQVSLRILLRSCLADSIASKPRDCGLEFNRRLFSPLISLSFKMQLKVVKDCWSLFSWKQSLEILGKQFCISGFLYELILNIEYNLERWQIMFCFFKLTICIPLVKRNKSTFCQTVFSSKLVKMYNFDQ